MTSFWIGFFVLVAALLALDLGVLHRRPQVPTIRGAAKWTVVWMSLGLAFSGFVYLMFENAWLGVAHYDLDSRGKLVVSHPGGIPAMLDYLEAFLLEYALSVDNIFVIALLFGRFRIPPQHQHRVLFWGILGAIVFRLTMLAGGAALAENFTWVFYVFGGYLAYQGLKLLREGDDDGAAEDPDKSRTIRFLRRFVRIVDGDHDGKFSIKIDGRRALTTAAVCLITIELTDIVFALDSIPAVLGVVEPENVFIMVTSNIFAILGLRSLYFVLAGAMGKFKYLKLALAVLLIVIGIKLFLHNHLHVPNYVSLPLIAGIIAVGVVASIMSKPPDDQPVAG